MSSHEEYRVRKMGGGVFSQQKTLTKAKIIEGIDKMWPNGGPFQMKGPSWDSFGQGMPKGDLAEQLVHRVPDTGYGRRWLVKKEGEGQQRLVVVKKAVADPTEGGAWLQLALDQLGDDYNWADVGPERFDCSGLIVYVARHFDVVLPHSCYQMWWQTPMIEHFNDRSKLMDGDLVFYDASERPTPDHIGIVDAPGMVVDASTSYDMVVHRPIDSNPIYGFGRLVQVNGKL